jgi:hypothetical protein
MSPTVFRTGKYRFYFNSREETRRHVHVQTPDGEAKFWLEPIVALSHAAGLRNAELTTIQKIVEERRNEICRAWKAHFERNS